MPKVYSDTLGVIAAMPGVHAETGALRMRGGGGTDSSKYQPGKVLVLSYPINIDEHMQRSVKPDIAIHSTRGVDVFILRPEVNWPNDPDVLKALTCTNPACHGRSLLQPLTRTHKGRMSTTRACSGVKTCFNKGRPSKVDVLFMLHSTGALHVCLLVANVWVCWLFINGPCLLGCRSVLIVPSFR